MAEERHTNVHEDLEDLLAEVAGADLPGYKGVAEVDEMEGLTAAQKKRRKKKNKKKEMKLLMEAAQHAASSGMDA